MPELPEVETIGRQLRRLVVSKTISSIEVLNQGSFRADQNSLIGKSITGVGRKGKVLVFKLQGTSYKGQEINLYIHLKMSGQLEFINHNISNPSKKARPFLERPGLSRSKHLRVAIGLTDSSYLLFHDQRKFGWITDDPAALPRGIDALDQKLTPKKLAEILASSNRPVKTILLDQSKIAGIGNIYASEILWQAGISPLAKFKDEGRRTKAEGKFKSKIKNQNSKVQIKIQKLRIAIRKIIKDAIASGGSTMDDRLYRQVSGESGNYWSRRRVYDRAGEFCRRPACRKKNAVIQKTVIAHRSIYFCPACQRLKT